VYSSTFKISNFQNQNQSFFKGGERDGKKAIKLPRSPLEAFRDHGGVAANGRKLDSHRPFFKLQ
jgi:hypothetical protein